MILRDAWKDTKQKFGPTTYYLPIPIHVRVWWDSLTSREDPNKYAAVVNNTKKMFPTEADAKTWCEQELIRLLDQLQTFMEAHDD